MFNFQKIREQFGKECTGCGLCLENCPIIPHTELKDVDPEKIMSEVCDLFENKEIGDLARKMIYSCLYCNTCAGSCPQGLNPPLGLAVGKAILREIGDPVPKGVASTLKVGEQFITMTIPSYQEQNRKVDWLITEIEDKPVSPINTVLFASCWGLVQREVLTTAVKILQRIDPSVKALGGFDYCCGELQFIAGRPEEAEQQFSKLIQGLNTLSPEKVVIFCPTCNMNFDHHNPQTSWSRTFITDFIAEHLGALGPFNKIETTVTVHDSCHFVRGVKPASNSPREILQAIPGIKIIEMENRREEAWCCGAYSIGGSGKPGLDFRDGRLKQAKDTGADILSLYCPGCHMVLGPEGPNHSIKVESVITLLGKSMGIR
jgi:heterodisulfide reductase subunit D